MLSTISMTLKALLWTAILCGASNLLCQNPPAKPNSPATAEPPPAPHLAFDIVSIHESGEGHTSFYDNLPRNSYFHGERITAGGLIRLAYGVKLHARLEKVPDWAENTKFDLTAKSDPSTDEALAKLSDDDSYAAKRIMLRGILADRFNLQLHTETRVATTYELVTTDRTAKLMTPVQGEIGKTINTCLPHVSKKGAQIDSKGCPFPTFLHDLQGALGTDVADHTGLSGMYAYQLEWDSYTKPAAEEEERYPPLADALRNQLGLELNKTKAPVTFWVVDHIERPTPN